MNKAIYFDMDGTIANLYGVENWLDDLINSRTTPYEKAQPMFNFSTFAKVLHRIQNKGYTIGIISWTSKNGTAEFNQRVATAKKQWLKRHLPSVEWDSINVIDYGTPKSSCGNGYLFDDEKRNRDEWNGIAYDVNNIIETLKTF